MNISDLFTTENTMPAPRTEEDMRMNSLYANSWQNQTQAKDNGDLGVVGVLLVAFIVLCILAIRKFQNS